MILICIANNEAPVLMVFWSFTKIERKKGLIVK